MPASLTSPPSPGGRHPHRLDGEGGELPPAARAAAAGAIVAAHLAAGWALLQLEPVRQAIGAAVPLFVEIIEPAPVPPPPVPVPPPPAPKPRVMPKTPPPPPVVAAPPAPAPAPFEVPPPPPEPAPPAPPMEAAPPMPAPVPAPPPPPAAPKTVSASQVQYLTPPSLSYPLQSKRLRESGQVTLRVLIEPNGRPSRIEVHSSSGFRRLDDAAIAAMRAARFKPYMENGQALAVWVQTPIRFDLEN